MCSNCSLNLYFLKGIFLDNSPSFILKGVLVEQTYNYGDISLINESVHILETHILKHIQFLGNLRNFKYEKRTTGINTKDL